MKAVIAAVLVGMLLVGCGNNSKINACARAIDTLHLSPGEHAKLLEENCDSLSHEDQKAAADLATKANGVIVFIPPYEAKAAK